MSSKNPPQRCFGNHDRSYAIYHDEEWGIPLHNDQQLFEMLSLEGLQAGLSWAIILKKRTAYQQLFHHFDPKKVAEMSDERLIALAQDTRLIRHRQKTFSIRNNAAVFCEIQQQYGSFDRYIWDFVNRQPIVNHWTTIDTMPTQSPTSLQMAKSLKKAGMKFVGPTIIYAYMQAIGMVDDHLAHCWRRTTPHHPPPLPQ